MGEFNAPTTRPRFLPKSSSRVHIREFKIQRRDGHENVA